MDAWITRYVDFIARHRLTIVIAGLLAAGAGGLYAKRLELRPNLTELLPENSQSVKDLKRISSRMISTDLLIVVIESANRGANEQAADALAAELRKLPPNIVARVKHRVDEEKAFFDRNKWLYPPLSDLESLRDRLELEITKKKNPLFIDLEEESDKKPIDPDELEAKYRAQYPELSRFEKGYLATPDGDLFVILLWPPDLAATEGAGEHMVRAVRQRIASVQPTEKWGVKVTLAGNIATAIEERAALVDDLVIASSVCSALVLTVILFYFRRFRALFYVGFPTLFGVTAAFAFAEAAFGGLNSSTAFLGSIILGNGINFPIVFASRYAEEAGRGRSPRDAVEIALRNTALPTLVAASAAAVAYGSLVLTDFRGFSQFGAIGGLGMLVCWLSTMTLLPAALLLCEGGMRRHMSLPSRAYFSGPGSHLVRSAPKLLIALGTALTIAAIVALPPYLENPIEYDFRNLRNRKTQTSGLSTATKRVDKLFGRSMTPAAVLANRPDQVPDIKRALTQQDHTLVETPVLDEIETVESLSPGSIDEQKEKIAVLDEIRRLLSDPGFELLEEEQRQRIMKLRPPAGLQPVTITDLPLELRRRFQEKDGTIGRVLLLYPNKTFSSWRGRDAMRFATVTRAITLPNGEVIHSASNSVIFADMINSILRDGPRATYFSLAAVILLVILLTRSVRGTLMVAGSLCIGVLWMVGAAAYFDEKVNFLNFVALPITFGIGVDYAVNIFSRYRAEGPGSMPDAVRSTGGAVVLCSATTIIGYGALLVADNRGLVSFGALAILGEFACLAAGAILMPAIVHLLDTRKTKLAG